MDSSWFRYQKLQINLVVEDALVSLDDLQAAVEEDEDHVQSTDIAAMQKIVSNSNRIFGGKLLLVTW